MSSRRNSEHFLFDERTLLRDLIRILVIATLKKTKDKDGLSGSQITKEIAGILFSGRDDLEKLNLFPPAFLYPQLKELWDSSPPYITQAGSGKKGSRFNLSTNKQANKLIADELKAVRSFLKDLSDYLEV